jgi:ketosteroid isomerase-like protein
MEVNMNAAIVMEFIRAINEADVDKIYALMTDDHVFVDSQNNKVVGKDSMKQAWVDFYKLFPDYRLEVNEVITKNEVVMVSGFASGTYKNLRHEDKDNSWIVPAAWKAVVTNGKIELWQIFADMSKAYEIVRRYAGTEIA